MVVTLETGLIVSKDQAADVVAPTLPASAHATLSRARQGYLGDLADDWTIHNDAESTAQILAGRIASMR